MEECKRMGIDCFGPDVNESKKGFSVNKKGHIRFGLGGLKGVGEAAVESIIEEREKNGPYVSIYDMIKRVNQRTVNKKTLESLVYAGGFDCFPDLHRAQYFFTPQNDTSSGLEKIVRFGNIFQAQTTHASNTLFGDLPAVMDIQPPKIPPCEPWSLTDLLNYEKEVTGMFLSGHPLDHFRFEIKHYGITTMAEFNEIKDTLALQANPGRSFRLAGLVTDAQHRVTRTGRQFGSFYIEDYSGKSEFMLWSDDYMRFTNYLEKGKNLFITGAFKPRFNKTEFEFKIEKISLLESIKQNLTKQVIINIEARSVDAEMISFFEKNLKTFPGSSILKFNVMDLKAMCRVGLQSIDTGFQMNDEMAAFLQSRPDIEVQVVTA
jgi:DNA polymerase-3 subunit alpha